MGISFGSASKKPYVGSKEVQEAYVGSQLVYKSGLPYYYMFLGNENDYFISPNLTFQANASVAKPKTVYKIALATNPSGMLRTGSFVINNISQFVGWKLKFTCYINVFETNKISINFRDKNNNSIHTYNTQMTQNEVLYEYVVPAQADRVVISTGTQGDTWYFDAVRFEEA